MAEPSGNENHNNEGLRSFWELGEYGPTVKRLEHGKKLGSAVDLMLRERAKVEKAYSNNLQTWAGRWTEFWNSKLECGSGASPWLGLCGEARAISNVHMGVHKELTEDIQTLLKNWQKEHYHKGKIPPYSLKESRQLEKEFDRAQKPWSKKVKKVQQCKNDYHDACKMERSLQVQVQNAKNDPSGTQEQLKKVEDKLSKAEKDVEETRSSYQSAIRDLESDTPRYLEEMTKVFTQSQEIERERLYFSKDVAIKFRDALNITENANIKSIFNTVDEAIESVDVDGDLAWWSAHHGVDMPAVFPVFEEYSAEVSAITKKKRAPTLDTNNALTVTCITPLVSAPMPIQPAHENDKDEEQARPNGVQLNKQLNPFDDDSESPAEEEHPQEHVKPEEQETEARPATVVDNSLATGDDKYSDAQEIAASADANEADYSQMATYDDGRPGVQVKALYDYAGQEEDELSFKADNVKQDQP